MTITGSGQIAFSDLNVEFGRSSNTYISLGSSVAGFYAQYGDTNRNTSAGRNIFNQVGISSDYALSLFYSYNDTATVHWTYNFENVSLNVVDINVDYNSVNLYNQVKFKGLDTNSDVDTGTSSGASLGNIDLTLDQGGLPNYVDINCYDTDTTTTIYQVTGDAPGNYTATTIGSIYGYQRFTLDLYFYD
jgi:hypothetical protein